MNPKLLEIWKEIRISFKPIDYFVILGFGTLSFVANQLGDVMFKYLFGVVFTFQLVRLFAVAFTDNKMVEEMNIKRAKRIYLLLKKEPKEDGVEEPRA